MGLGEFGSLRWHCICSMSAAATSPFRFQVVFDKRLGIPVAYSNLCDLGSEHGLGRQWNATANRPTIPDCCSNGLTPCAILTHEFFCV